MIVKNKVKYNMYKFLKTLDKTNDAEKTKNIMLKSISEEEFNYTILECTNNHFVDGFICNKGCVNNNVIVKSLKNFYITLNGYEFLKNYYGFIVKLVRDLFLILVTAIVTVNFDNWFSSTEQPYECICNQNTSRNSNK